ncbi:hypothetical protein N7491_004851 [Penicillium cf. griseofulvum]|uniref:Uncharacterized protein n=1 Tax=Penicillium cf. griseofulvum TaxID=2972120 RepID=A0A9W9M5Z4_9EURO|nr:hypothetical protein N7472_007541 [Penicillium cf. griseofulvum]KAJ5434256.1 hypothetical protein N7491_004851 [Penicillium cf. griseofulvum]KAJ5452085.1 hypothetical protein N7445_000268 [Penicillium cf. griseofulvum]
MASTPPPPSPSELRVPRAPRHGAKHDNYEPYPTRYSTRLAVQRASRAVQTTPPPSHPSASAKPGVSKRTLSPSSPGTAKPSPRKAARSHRAAASRISPFESELSLPRTSSHNTSRSSAEQALPTPAKTPSKKKVIGSDSSTSRSLFPSTSTPKRRKMDTTKQSAADSPAIFVDEPLIGYNIQAAEQELGISIHEDSRDRIPVIGPLSTDSFISQAARAVVRPATRSNPSPHDGAYFVHRGKKIFKRFDDLEDEGEDEDDLGLFANRPDLLADNPEILKSVKPLKRGDIKPRLLFPLAVTPTNGEEDVTDVEDHEDHEPMSPTPANEEDEARLTPPILPDPATSFESESSSVAPCAPVGHTGLQFTRSTVGNVSPSQPASFSEDLGFNTSTDDQTRSRGLSTSSGSSLLKYWPSVSRKTRGLEARTDRVKRLREARGSPAPRTRQAVRAEASGESSTADPSTSDS